MAFEPSRKFCGFPLRGYSFHSLSRALVHLKMPGFDSLKCVSCGLRLQGRHNLHLASFLLALKLGLCFFVLALPYSSFCSENQNDSERLTDLTLEQLGKIETTTASKEPEEVWN